MPISGLLVTLSEDLSTREEAVTAIRSHRAFIAGKQSERWLPVAMEAADDNECRAYHDWLMALPGVTFIDVVTVDFQEDEAQINSSSL